MRDGWCTTLHYATMYAMLWYGMVWHYARLRWRLLGFKNDEGDTCAKRSQGERRGCVVGYRTNKAIIIFSLAVSSCFGDARYYQVYWYNTILLEYYTVDSWSLRSQNIIDEKNNTINKSININNIPVLYKSNHSQNDTKQRWGKIVPKMWVAADLTANLSVRKRY